MTKKIRQVLVLYKKSAYANYFLDRTSSLRNKRRSLPQQNINRLVAVHEQHYRALQRVEDCLREVGLKYHKSNRGERIDYSRFDLIVTVGGDGTFLEAARNIKDQLIIGVNSSPKWSVGKFCRSDIKSFPFVIERVIEGRFKVKLLHRLRITGLRGFEHDGILNDVLIAHRNPAAMSRYSLIIGAVREEQRSSGIWIATAAGSTGAIYSAGGMVLRETRGDFQYLCRELYPGNDKKYKLRRGILGPRQHITVTSLMREGMIFADGARLSRPFVFGATLCVGHSPLPLKLVDVG